MMVITGSSGLSSALILGGGMSSSGSRFAGKSLAWSNAGKSIAAMNKDARFLLLLRIIITTLNSMNTIDQPMSYSIKNHPI
jgi:hypothetical protein